jgi:hypothetical protein
MPFPENTPSVDDMLNMPTGELARMPVELLAIVQNEIDARLKRDKAAKTRLDGALSVRYADRAAKERQAHGKDTGTVRFDDGDFTIVADLPKRVDWDQEKLAQIAANIAHSGEDPAEFIDTKLSVPERKYGALPESWRDGFEPARTVRMGTLKITIAPNEAA